VHLVQVILHRRAAEQDAAPARQAVERLRARAQAVSARGRACMRALQM